MNRKVRVRFAPSPTGGLHLGGMRTVLFNYLFAKQYNGDFVLRIEDTDRTRFVEGAEQYIIDCLNWCGLTPDEGPHTGGNFAPYRQSERKESYRQYAEQLVKAGYAYYAFDTTEELEAMRTQFKTHDNPTPQYNYELRERMRNSLTLGAEEVQKLLNDNTPHVIRIKMPLHETVTFTDMIRGAISFDTSLSDDKVLLKADGMPTYHLAVVVDDYLMEISHAFRGEEWLPSAPVHILLWKYLGWENKMPEWAHLPLILKPDGNGKLSKRDGDRLGFPVFAMNWTDPKTNDHTEGFKEKGFLPQAFVNMLAMLGWNDGTDKEIFTTEELIKAFSIDRVHKGGAKFDYEKAKWFNHEWIKKLPVSAYAEQVKKYFEEAGYTIHDTVMFTRVLELVKDRCTLLTDFVQQASFFFKTPETFNVEAIKGKWDEKKTAFFNAYLAQFANAPSDAASMEAEFKALANEHQLKPGELMLPLRIILVGDKFGPGVFDIASIIGKEETEKRIITVLHALK